MKRTLSFIALLLTGSILLPLHVATSLAAKPVSASSKTRVLTVRVAPMKRTSKPAKTITSPSPVLAQTTTRPPAAFPVPPRVPATWTAQVTPPTALETRSDNGDGLRAVDDAQMTDRHRQLAKLVLGLLPRDCQAKLQSFTVLYDNPKHRGLAGKGVIILAGNVPDTEFVGLLMHEGLGHFADLTCWNGTQQSGDSPFVDAGDVMYRDDPSVAFYGLSWSESKVQRFESREQDFVSGYALTDAYEDFAESVAYYFLQEEAFATRAQTNPVLAGKLAWLRAHYPKTGTPIVGAAWNGQIPWDATKVAYDWPGA